MNTIADRLRGLFSRLAPRMFAAPYLPDGLIFAAILLIVLNAGLALAVQPPAYWSNSTAAQHELFLVHALLGISPLAFASACLVYIAAAWLAMEALTRSLALLVWTALAFLHTTRLITQAAQLLDLEGVGNSGELTITHAILAGLVVGVLLAALLLRPARKPADKARSAQTPETKTAAEGTAESKPDTAIPAPAAAISAGKRRIWPKILRWQVLVIAICAVAAAGGVLWYFTQSHGGWQRVRPQRSPGSRCCGVIAYDLNRGRAVLFGGSTQSLGPTTDQLDDTWEWNGQDWVKIQTASQPSPRINAAMAYDVARKVMVLFGGQNKNNRLNDTWTYDHGAWKYMPGGDSPLPPGRTGHRLFFDPTRQKIVLSGGYGGVDSGGQYIFYKDAWEWDGQAWKEIVSQTSSPTITSYSFAQDPVSQRIIAVYYNSALTWAGDHWTNFTAGSQPETRSDASMGSLPGVGVLMFGGSRNNAFLDDTWVLHGTTWQRIVSPLHPSARSTTMTFSDPMRGSVYVYGGDGGFSPYLDDMWVYHSR